MQRHPTRRRIRALRRITAQTHAARQSQSQQSVRHFVFLDELRDELLDFVRDKWQADFQMPDAMQKPFHVLRPAKRPAVANSHDFKQAVAVKKPTVKDRHDRAFFRHKLAVEENQHGEFLTQRRQDAEKKVTLSCRRRRKESHYFPSMDSMILLTSS